MQITIQKIWPMDAGKANGKFVGTDGKSYFIEAAMFPLIAEGMTIDPPSVKPSVYNGKTNYFLPKGFVPRAVTGEEAHAAAPPQPTHTTHPPPAAAPRANGATPPPFFSEVEKSGYIFVTGCMQQALSSAKYDTQDIPLLAQALVDAWNTHIKAKV